MRGGISLVLLLLTSHAALALAHPQSPLLVGDRPFPPQAPFPPDNPFPEEHHQPQASSQPEDLSRQLIQKQQAPCPPLSNPSSPTDLLLRMTDPCRYDRYTRPGDGSEPLVVKTRMYVYYLGNIEAHTLQFSAHVMIRYRWRDPRLAYSARAPSINKVIGEKIVRDRIWVPHVYVVNEHDSKVMGSDREDVIVTIKPSGTVLFSTRMKVTMLCIMNFQKFPFDEQNCPMILESWTYNTTEMVLEWETDNPVALDSDLRLTEYSLTNLWTKETYVTYYNEDDMPYLAAFDKFSGNYSRLEVGFKFEREIGHYIMDYYVPSILLVVVSWVSFWLDPNAVPGRTTLGTSTMLTFITLTRNSGSPIPKVSYIKATEIWFMVCTAFIFGSLVEFAFVNTIWRRKNNIALKKVNTKYVLKSTLTPTLHRKQLMERCRSCPDMVEEGRKPQNIAIYNPGNHLSVGSVSSMDSICEETFPSTVTSSSTLPAGSTASSDCQDIVFPVPCRGANGHMGAGEGKPPTSPHGFTTMTPQQIAQWIDRRSRLVFPLSFLVFNVLYWGFVWI